MHIRSQDKLNLTKTDVITIEEEWLNDKDFVFKNAIIGNTGDYEFLLGEYETEARAKEVLDGIQNAIYEVEWMKCYPQNGFISPIYQMPEK